MMGEAMWVYIDEERKVVLLLQTKLFASNMSEYRTKNLYMK